MMPEGELVPGDEHPLAKAIRSAIGTGPYDKVTVVTPQFERTDGKTVTFIPSGAKQFDDLKANAPDWVLKDIGMGIWDRLKDGRVHWLFPSEWYEAIPKGYPILYINGLEEQFEPGVTDSDRRYGVLAYGWIRSEKP